MAFVVWCQYIGPTIFLVLFNVIFASSLRSQLVEQVPGANADYIIAAGATQFRRFVSPKDLPGVLVAYCNSLDRVFYLVAACGVVSWFTAWGMGWKDIRKNQEGSPTSFPKAEDEEKADNTASRTEM